MYKHHHLSVSIDDIAVVPESVTTYSDDDVDLSVKIGNLDLKIPVIGAAMDSVSSLTILHKLCKHGGIGIINLCGLISRYRLFDGYDEFDKKLRENPCIETLQNLYNSHPIDTNILSDNLAKLRDELKSNEIRFAVSATPQYAERLFDVALAQKCCDTFVIQSSFVSPYWSSKKSAGLNVGKFIQFLKQNSKTIMVGNVASLNAAVPFIEAGVDAIIEGVGPGVICTTRTVLGIGAGHVDTIDDLRSYIEKQKSKTKIIADGDIHTSGDIIKLMCVGAHAVILGGALARTIDAPFVGYHWGMSAMHRILPRGTLLTHEVDENISVERLLFGPSSSPDGVLAMIPAITNALSNLGCLNIDSAYRDTKVVRFKGMKTEGKRM